MAQPRSLDSFVGADFGGRLRAARQARGLTVRDLAQRTKIPVPTLEALERNDPSRLAGGIFTRSFLRAYAAESGLDPDDVIRQFALSFPERADLDRATRPVVPPGAAHEFLRRGHGRTNLVVIAVVAAGVAWAMAGRPGLRGDAGSDAAPASGAMVGTSGVSSVSAARGVDAAPAALGQEVREPFGGGEAASAGLRVSIEAQRTCWVRMTLDGTLRRAYLLRAGERIEHDAADSILLEVGDAGALAYTLNGAPGRPLGRSGEVVRRRIDRSNLDDFLK